MFRSKNARRYALIGVIGGAFGLGAVAGCDSTPAPPTDASPEMPKESGVTKKGKFTLTKGKGEPLPPADAPPAAK